VAHIWLQSAQPWLDIEDAGTQRFEREPDDRSLLAELWRRQSAPD
jgi:hypothetical protein